ncbi:PPOX class F420-dependent oxidoreductase [Naumannella huperziae]
MTAFTEPERGYLARQPIGRLATLQPSGTLQNSPVGYRLNDDDSIDIFGRDMANSRKYKNVASHDRVAFVVDDLASTDPWTPRSVEIRGRAEQITGKAGAYFDGAGIRIRPEWVFSIGLNPRQGGPRRVG